MRCPVCQADNNGTPCRRCRADLSLLVQIEEQRQAAAAAALRHAGMGLTAEAVADAQRMHQCRTDAESWRLLAVTHLLHRDFAEAWRCYRAALAAM
jgi:hypothetical protein